MKATLGFHPGLLFSLEASADHKSTSSALIAPVVFHVIFPIKIDVPEGCLDEFADRMRLVRREHKVVAFAVLKDAPHAFDIFGCVSPVAFCVQVAEEQLLLQT